MGPKPSPPQTAELFRHRLGEQINMQQPLVKPVKLAKLIGWTEIDRAFVV